VPLINEYGRANMPEQNITPEEVEEVFYEAYSSDMVNFLKVGNPIIQRQVRDKAWRAVIDYITERVWKNS
jgi:hypothetical protein